MSPPDSLGTQASCLLCGIAHSWARWKRAYRLKSETFQTRASIATRMRVKEWLPRPPQFQRLARNCDDAEARVLQPASLVRELKPVLAGLCSALHHRWSEL